MKKKYLFLLAITLLFSTPVFAFTCEQSQGVDSGESCWVGVRLTSSEQTLVSTGTALVYHIDATTPEQGSYQVRVSTASSDNFLVAGFAQGPIATGDNARVLVRGFGFVRTTGGVVSGDPLSVVASGNVARSSFGTTVSQSASWIQSYVSGVPVAVALQTSTTNGSTARSAYIRVI